MRLAALMEVAIQLAGQEAIASQYPQIEPEHLLEAVLKCSELQDTDAGGLAQRKAEREQLATEAGDLRAEVAKRRFDSTSLRRELRSVMGKGHTVYAGGAMHRSAASRAVCEAAAVVADDNGERALTTVNLLTALLASPTAMITKALKAAADQPAADASAPQKTLADALCPQPRWIT